MEFYTIGVYNSTEDEFFGKLTTNNIDTFCDIRQRRGVRGAKYSFANNKRLQKRLNELGIKCNYIPELAPTREIRILQKETDRINGESSKERHELGKVFMIEYKNRILTPFDFETFLDKLNQTGANRVVFFCVEEFAQACHRSMMTDKLKEEYNFQITHL